MERVWGNYAEYMPVRVVIYISFSELPRWGCTYDALLLVPLVDGFMHQRT